MNLFPLEFNSLNEKIYVCFFSMIIWTVFLFLINNTVKPERLYRNLTKKSSDDIRNRLISISHGLFSFFMTSYHMYKHSPQYNEPISNFQHFLILVSMSYFTYDLLACMYYDLTDAGLYIHHLLVIFGYVMDELYGYGGTETLSKKYKNNFEE